MEQYVNIMLDRGFKAVFGNKQVVIDFINAALEGEREIKDLTYLDKETQPESLDQRTVILGVRMLYCRTKIQVKLLVRSN